MSIQSINPATGEVIETFQETAPQALERILATAHAAFGEWRHTPFGKRAPLMRKAAEILRARKSQYARTMALEMGKPIAQGEAEVVPGRHADVGRNERAPRCIFSFS